MVTVLSKVVWMFRVELVMFSFDENGKIDNFVMGHLRVVDAVVEPSYERAAT